MLTAQLGAVSKVEHCVRRWRGEDEERSRDELGCLQQKGWCSGSDWRCLSQQELPCGCRRGWMWRLWHFQLVLAGGMHRGAVSLEKAS